jgi:hypothetical protein
VLASAPCMQKCIALCARTGEERWFHSPCCSKMPPILHFLTYRKEHNSLFNSRVRIVVEASSYKHRTMYGTSWPLALGGRHMTWMCSCSLARNTDGTCPYWVWVEPNQTRTHVLKSYPPPAPAPACGYIFCSIPTPARVKKTWVIPTQEQHNKKI